MAVYGRHQILIGDVLDGLGRLAPGSARCCVTSPPYWGLRDYGVEGQIGLEPTPEAFLARMVEVFRGVKRVLADDGTCWVNMGDCYNGVGGPGAQDGGTLGDKAALAVEGTKGRRFAGLKPKDLVGMPWRLALALQADGWYLRSDIIWAKPNPMPESVTDRPTKSHEHIFLLSKSERYFYDAEAIKEPMTRGDAGSAFDSERKLAVHPTTGRNRSGRGQGKQMPPIGGVKHAAEHGGTYSGETRDWPTGRNARDVWTIPTQAYAEAHFATFPEALPERCIKAGTSARGRCPACGAAWMRRVGQELVVDHMMVRQRAGMQSGDDAGERQHGAFGKTGKSAAVGTWASHTLGWDAGCEHALDPVPDVVLDPFAGSGTTLLVACRLGRDAVGCELNPQYAALAEKRIGAGLRPSTYRDHQRVDAGGLFV